MRFLHVSVGQTVIKIFFIEATRRLFSALASFRLLSCRSHFRCLGEAIGE